MSEAATLSRPAMIVAATIGNALEFYDFVIYGFFAVTISRTFFPGGDPTMRLLLTFGTFSVSFFARPVGALILGRYADRSGRAACMVLAVALMTLASTIMAVLPSAATIGLAAPFGVLAARLLQGFALGGEFGSSTALMIEHSAGNETRAASWQGTSQYLASLVASGVAWLLSQQPTVPILHAPGFRVAFAIGALAGPVALVLRRRLHDAPSFLAQRQSPDRQSEPVTQMLGGIAIATGLVAMGTAQTYLLLYLPTYAATQLHMHAGSALGSVFLIYAAILVTTPLRLRLAARFDAGRRTRMMLLSCLAVLLTAFPMFLLLGLWPVPAALFLLPFAFTLIALPYFAPLSGVMGMVFPTEQRGTGLSVGYALGIALFGGTAPLIDTWLVARTGDARSPALYLVLTAIVTGLAILAAGRRLQQGRRSPA